MLIAMSPTTLLAPAILAAVLCIAPGTHAQRFEYVLTPEGTWELIDRPDPGTDEAILAEVRQLLAQDRPSDAWDMVDAWISVNDAPNHPLLAEALFLRGDAWTASGNEFEALYDYERVIKEFPSSPYYTRAVERELDIAVRYSQGLRRKFLGLRIFGAKDIAEELFIRTAERVPGSRLAERALIELGDHYYRERELELASEAYDLFIENFPDSRYTPRAMRRRVYSTVARYKGPEYDGSALRDAKVLISRYNNLYPEDAARSGLDESLLTRIDESQAREQLETARWYMKRGEDASARHLLRRLITEFPASIAATSAVDILERNGWLETVQQREREEQPAPPTDTQTDSQTNNQGAATDPRAPSEINDTDNQPTDQEPAP